MHCIKLGKQHPLRGHFFFPFPRLGGSILEATWHFSSISHRQVSLMSVSAAFFSSVSHLLVALHQQQHGFQFHILPLGLFYISSVSHLQVVLAAKFLLDGDGAPGCWSEVNPKQQRNISKCQRWPLLIHSSKENPPLREVEAKAKARLPNYQCVTTVYCSMWPAH